jgi:SAM-dependent methyltransferase
MENGAVNTFFEKNAESWIITGYNDDGYNYPTGLHRARIIQKILGSLGDERKIVDMGCGGGNVSMMLAELGHSVTGIDGANKMIEISENLREQAAQEVQARVKFYCRPITENELEEGQYDVCIAMGVIGYLPEDEILFNEANRLLKPGGLFLVSCRNRLFNMQSISFRTVNEIKNNEAEELIEEMGELYEKVPAEKVDDMIHKLKDIAAVLPDRTTYDNEAMKDPAKKLKGDSTYKPYHEPKQHTPKRLSKTALSCGFQNKAYHGVHPHLIDPRLNKLLPPQIFNKISGCLEAFEELPISLVCSSVFIGVFQKQ